MSAQQPSRITDTADERASEHCPPKPHTFERPVTWLLGSSLLRHMGWIALNTIFGRRLGGIDWMYPEVVRVERELHDPAQAGGQADRQTRRQTQQEAETQAPEPAAAEELWFDYLSDSGDSQKATYNVAYLCLSDLWAETEATGAAVHLDEAPGATRLPRGQFLFLGGDTAYHVANYRTLLTRFRNPFYWAYRELAQRGHASVRRKGRIYAIPGNHDYYDALRGFNRQFRRPIEPPGLLDIPCFERVQEASYMALELPYGWWMFGMDMHGGELDRRQRVYFRRIVDAHRPQKLIVATAEPTTVLGRRMAEDAPVVSTLEQGVGVPAPFARAQPRMPEGQCRLDLSGDVHQYARYWGPPDTASYASVVSGLGGAFLHPTCTSFGQIEPNAQFPAAHTARRQVIKRLLSGVSVLLGGNMLVLGCLVGAVLFGAWRSAGTDRLLEVLASGIEGAVPGGVPASGRIFPVLAADTSSLLTNGAFWALACGVAGGILAVRLLIRYAAHVHDGRDTARPYLAYLGFAVAGASPLCAGLLGPPLPPASLTQSTVLFIFLVFALGAIYVAIWHREILDERAKQSVATKWFDDLFALGIATSGFVAIAGAFWRYGDFSVSRVGFHWAFLTLVVVVAGIGLVINGGLVGARRHGVGTKRWFAALGLWHAVLQVGVPLLWARHGLSLAAFLYIPLFVVMNLCGYWVGCLRSVRAARIGLVALWLVTGIIGLLLPLWAPGSAGPELWPHTLFLALFTGVTGCLWFGWYLAVSLVFNGHNNEIGGAVRIEHFVELMRIRITPDSLTAYVIGIDTLQAEGTLLKPRLVDVFTLEPGERPTPSQTDRPAP